MTAWAILWVGTGVMVHQPALLLRAARRDGIRAGAAALHPRRSARADPAREAGAAARRGDRERTGVARAARARPGRARGAQEADLMRGAAASPSERAGAVPVRGPSSPGGPGLDVSSLTCGRGDRSLRPPFCEGETMQCWPEDGWIDPEPPRWGWGTVALALAALALSGGLVAALAHQAPSGWRYDYRCCGDYDCAPLAPGAAREVTGGYRITIAPGSHPSVPADAPAWTAFVPHGDPRIEASGDDRRHACIGRPSGRLICLYIAPGGV